MSEHKLGFRKLVEAAIYEWQERKNDAAISNLIEAKAVLSNAGETPETSPGSFAIVDCFIEVIGRG